MQRVCSLFLISHSYHRTVGENVDVGWIEMMSQQDDVITRKYDFNEENISVFVSKSLTRARTGTGKIEFSLKVARHHRLETFPHEKNDRVCRVYFTHTRKVVKLEDAPSFQLRDITKFDFQFKLKSSRSLLISLLLLLVGKHSTDESDGRR